MQGVIKKWGNSAAVRIPASVLAAAKLDVEHPVEVREEAGRVVIEPIRPARYELADLLAGITSENVHDVVDTGPPRGREVW